MLARWNSKQRRGPRACGRGWQAWPGSNGVRRGGQRRALLAWAWDCKACCVWPMPCPYPTAAGPPPSRPPPYLPTRPRPTPRTCMLISLSRGSNPPCTMANRFCSVGRQCAAMQRSIQRVVRWVASSKRAGSLRERKVWGTGSGRRVYRRQLLKASVSNSACSWCGTASGSVAFRLKPLTACFTLHTPAHSLLPIGGY